jgi:phosphate transport system substrate-binding protein
MTRTRLGHVTRSLCSLGFVVALVAGCGGSKSSRTTLQMKGSDTMVNLAQAWAEAYVHADTAVDLEVSGGGSGVGIAALIRGTIDLASASRNMKPEEVEQARAHTGKQPKEFVVGYDALAIYVHRENPIETISIEQLARIYEENSTVSKWSQIGVVLDGGDDEVVRISRQSSSGTYEFFREHVLNNRDFMLGSRDMNGSKEVVELVGHTKTAIGYSGMGYATDDIKMLRVTSEDGKPAAAPSIENVHNKSYPLARPLLVYTLGEPEGATKRFIDWILSDEGQRLVEESGYVPVAAAQPDATVQPTE